MTPASQKFAPNSIVVSTEEQLAEITARRIVEVFTNLLSRKKTINFIPSSGRTPVKTYQFLVKNYRDVIDWSRVKIVQMDEYLSADLESDAYFFDFLERNLVTPLGVETFLSMQNPDKKGLYSPQAYKEKLNAIGPIDFALHGIGRNGHIGFNEPKSNASSETRHVKLATETQNDNFPRSDGKQKPHMGMTMGLNDLRKVKHSVLIASGVQKALAIHNLMNQLPVSQTPASILWESASFEVFIDVEAASLL